jgi:hypothetical protein
MYNLHPLHLRRIIFLFFKPTKNKNYFLRREFYKTKCSIVLREILVTRKGRNLLIIVFKSAHVFAFALAFVAVIASTSCISKVHE